MKKNKLTFLDFAKIHFPNLHKKLTKQQIRLIHEIEKNENGGLVVWPGQRCGRSVLKKIITKYHE